MDIDGAAAFTAIYATALELAALGLSKVGVISARRQAGVTDGEALPWPHLGSVALHSAISAVATVAAVVLVLVIGAIHHTGMDLAVLAVPLALGAVILARLTTALRGARRSA